MSLMDEYNVPCVLLTKTRVDDSLGGYKTVWKPDVHFDAAWEYLSAPEILVAEKEDVERTYRIYVPKTLNLDFHEVFRRSDDGQIYRVTNPGKDRTTPSFSRLDKRLIEVEKWEIPNSDTVDEEETNVQGS